MSRSERIGHFLASMILNLFILLIPYIMPILYHEMVYERKACLALSVFLLNVALGSRVYFFVPLLVISMIYIGMYGAVDSKSTLQSFNCNHIFVALAGIIVLLRNKYDLHYRKGEKFLSIN